MNKTLFLLCPTDCLEPIINDRFRHDNFFYTSLGNSLSLDFKTLESIKELIIEYDITDVFFVISNNNKIVLDALGDQCFSGIRGLREFYDEILRQKEHSVALRRNDDFQSSIISYYLNYRIKELKIKLEFSMNKNSIHIDGRIFNRQNNNFDPIYSSLICLEKQCLN